MPFCPKCRFEYVPGAAACPDCGAALVDSLPEAEAPLPHDFTQVELCVVEGEIHAKLVQNALASQGIPSRIDSPWPFHTPLSATGLPFPFGGGFNADIRIMVNRSDLDRARAVYRDFESRRPEPDEAAASDQ
jgi:hypothetical protein